MSQIRQLQEALQEAQESERYEAKRAQHFSQQLEECEARLNDLRATIQEYRKRIRQRVFGVPEGEEELGDLYWLDMTDEEWNDEKKRAEMLLPRPRIFPLLAQMQSKEEALARARGRQASRRS